MLRSIVWLGLAGVIVVGTSMGRAKTEAPPPATQPATQQATLPQTLRRRPPVTPVIRIDGDVVGVAAGESGTLTVHVDGQVVGQVAATADGFVVDVPASPSGMVTLEYAQPGIHFISPLGSYARLVRMAGADGRLTRDECECTRISAFSTALQHAADIVLGHPPRNDAEFRRAARQVGNDLTNATTALARLAADPSQLPPTHGTGLALLRDRPAFVEFLYGTHFMLIDDPATALESLPTAAVSGPDLPERFALLGPALDVGRPTATTAVVLEREGNAFRMHAASGSFGVSHVGTVDDNALVMVPDGEIALVNPNYICPTTGERTDRHWKATRDVLQRQWASEGLEIWRRVGESEVSFPDCPDMPGYVERWASFMPAFDLADTGVLTNARRFLGDRALPMFCSTAGEHNGVPLGDCGYAVHRFSRDGSGEVVELGNKVDFHLQPVQAHGRMPFSWTMGTDGAMHVQAGDERTRYWVLDGGDRTALGVVHVADAERETGHASLAGYSPMIRVGVTDSYNAANVPGAWGYASYDRLTTPHIDSEASEVRILRDASGSSVQWEAGYTGSLERWTTAGGRLYSTRYSSSNCQAPSDECQPQMVRYFRPLARVGDRIHGIEEMYYYGGTDSSGNALPPTVVSRPQFHERREMPEDMPGDGVVTPRPAADRRAVLAR
ncbi:MULTISPECIES: hypothetical protein [unclassified Luteimonas]